MAIAQVTCPECGSKNVVKNGKQANGTPRFRCDNPNCERRYFQMTYVHQGRRPKVKRQIIEMALNGAGIRDTSRVLSVGRNTVSRAIKKTRITAGQSTGSR